MKSKKIKVGVIGLGYVGLPLAISFAKFYNVIGFDIKKNRINKLSKSLDLNKQINKKEFNTKKTIKFTNSYADLSICKIIII